MEMIEVIQRLREYDKNKKQTTKMLHLSAFMQNQNM